MSRNHGIHLLLAAALALCAWAAARAETETPEASATEVTETRTDAASTSETPEPSLIAPMPVGNIEDGKTAYVVCAVCHLENGAGRPDGIFPQLAGQHASVTYRQIADTREERRSNPVMCPFTVTLTDPQVQADLAVYIESLPLPTDNGRGPGTDYAMGAELYTRDCAECHGDRGQGSAEELVPMIASQHFAYLTRQIDDIARQHRKNADSKMVQLAATYSQRECQAVADFVSRLEEAPQLIPAPEADPE